MHPFLRENETQIDEFITSAHNRLMDAGMAYLKLAIEHFKTKVLGLPPSEPTPPPTPQPAGPQSYTQSLLSRFSVPAARWSPSATSGPDFYSMLSGAVAAATGTSATASSSSAAGGGSSTLIPPHLQGSSEKMTFISAQRDRLNIVLSALDREAQSLRTEAQRAGQAASSSSSHRRAPSMSYDGMEDDDNESTQRPGGYFGSSAGGLSKSRSEVDFEKIDAESGAEDDASLRRRHGHSPGSRGSPGAGGGGGWMPWGWGAGSPEGRGTSSGMER